MHKKNPATSTSPRSIWAQACTRAGARAQVRQHLRNAARIDPHDPHVRALLQQAQAALEPP